MLTDDALLGTANPTFPKIRRLAGPAFSVNSLPQSLEFYRDIMGFAVVYQEPNYALLRTGDVSLGLMTRPSQPGSQSPCAVSLLVEVEDVWSFYRHLRNRGVKASEPNVQMRERKLLTTEFSDLNGIRWALVESYR